MDQDQHARTPNTLKFSVLILSEGRGIISHQNIIKKAFKEFGLVLNTSGSGEAEIQIAMHGLLGH
ncbi:MAG: hypothetical protein QXO75_00290 [Nitrososphaerota archaeon]